MKRANSCVIQLAHNLVLPHNSEHSFYTSQIAQTFFISMAAHLASTVGATRTESVQSNCSARIR